MGGGGERRPAHLFQDRLGEVHDVLAHGGEGHVLVDEAEGAVVERGGVEDVVEQVAQPLPRHLRPRGRGLDAPRGPVVKRSAGLDWNSGRLVCFWVVGGMPDRGASLAASNKSEHVSGLYA